MASENPGLEFLHFRVLGLETQQRLGSFVYFLPQLRAADLEAKRGSRKKASLSMPNTDHGAVRR